MKGKLNCSRKNVNH